MKKILILLAVILTASCFVVSCNKVDKNDPATSVKDIWDVPYQYDLSEYIDISREDYIGVAYSARNSEATDEEINAEINALLAEHATYADISDRPAEKGDLVNIDFQGYLDGVAFEGGTAKGEELELGVGGYITGFEDGVVGHNIGETFTIDATFPEDYGVDDLNGKTAQFEITLNSIKEIIYPELTDAFVAANTDSETVIEYYAALKEEITESNSSSAKVLQKNEAFDTIVKNCKILSYPEKEYQQYYSSFISQYMAAAQSAGVDFETYITETAKITMAEFNTYAEDYAKSMIEQELVFFAIAHAEGVFDVLTKADYDNYLTNVSAEYMSTPEQFVAMYGEDSIWRSLVYDSVMDWVLENGIEVVTKE